MRVISGYLKGRTIKGHDIKGTRPTMSRVKESIFASIQDYTKDSITLDLFAGSGSLGIEAISNGSKYCYFIDNNKIAVNIIKENITNLNINDKTKIIHTDYNKALSTFKDNNIKFDLIFIDPPYNYKNINDIIETITNYNILNKNGLLILEFKYDNISLDNNVYLLHKFKKYGDKFISIYKKTID
ncbi:MAG: 16S rRNA (guanine(966)-N(2))-methyltransferase RsmD [Bacilli bacterium]|nr:16S rRNA (guanine(966)-N(2))-methyltransferase RsmD [Bacilli bacterium]